MEFVLLERIQVGGLAMRSLTIDERRVLRGVSLKHCARIILIVTSHLLNSQEVLIRLQQLSLITAWPRMT